MRCHKPYQISGLENFSPDTLKMAAILRHDLRYSKVRMRGKALFVQVVTLKMNFY